MPYQQLATPMLLDAAVTSPKIGMPLSQSIVFSPDNSYDIGASGGSRPRDIYARRNLYVGGAVAGGVLAIQVSAGGNSSGDISGIQFLSLAGSGVGELWNDATGGTLRLKSIGNLALHTGNVGISSTGQRVFIDTNGNTDVVGWLRPASGNSGTPPSTGKGLEMFYSLSDYSVIQSYDRSGGTYKDLYIGASNINFQLPAGGGWNFGGLPQLAAIGSNVALNSPGPTSTVLCTLTLASVGWYRIDGQIMVIAPGSGAASTASFQISDDTVGTSLRGGQVSSSPNGYRYTTTMTRYYKTTVANTVIALRGCGQAAGWQAMAYEDIYFGANASATYLQAMRVG